MEKLVRDRIPDIIREDRGKAAPFRIASPEEYHQLLTLKLREEVGEYLSDRDPLELADIMEVVHALAEESGLTLLRLEAMREKKARERGGFRRRIVMDF